MANKTNQYLYAKFLIFKEILAFLLTRHITLLSSLTWNYRIV